MTDSTLKDKRQQRYECAEQASIMAGNGCGACQRKGFPLLLVRKSVIPKQFNSKDETKEGEYDKSFHNIPWSQGMVTLKDREPTETLQTHESCFRLLRTGYVYIFLRTRNVSDKAKRAVLAYEVTPSGCYRHKPIATTTGLKSYQVEDIPLSCKKENHFVPARFVTVDHTRYSHAWVAYSGHPWNTDVLEYYRALPEAEMKRFTCIVLPKNAHDSATELTDGRSFSAQDFFSNEAAKKKQSRYLVEFEFDKSDRVLNYYDFISQPQTTKGSLSNADPQAKKNNEINTEKVEINDLPEFNKDYFYTASQFNSLKTDIKLYQEQLANFDRKFFDTPAVVVEDCLGLAEELAVQKRIALRPHAIGLLATEAKVVDKKSALFLPENVGETDNDSKFIVVGDIFEGEKEVLNTVGHKNHELYNMMYSVLVGDAEQDGGSFNEQIVERDKKRLAEKKAAGKNRYDYHENEMIFKRRLLSNIENFEQGIIENYEAHLQRERYVARFYSSEKSYKSYEIDCIKYYDDSDVYNGILPKAPVLSYHEENVSVDTSYIAPSVSAHYGPPVVLTKEDEASLLEQFNKILEPINKNRFGHSNFATPIVAGYVKLYPYQLKPVNKELEKYQSLINRPLLDLFKEELKLSYSWMMEDIKLITADYYTYATWLIADPSKEKLSNFGPKLNGYNNVPFWLTEVSADCSNAHIGYLMDMVTIFQPEHLGSIKLDYQFSLYDNLLRDENTLYMHLLKGGLPAGKNLWDTLIALREDPANEKKSTQELIDAMYEAAEKRTLTSKPAHGDVIVNAPEKTTSSPISTEALDHINNLLDLPTDKDQTKLAVRLFDLLSEKTYISLSNMPKGAALNRIFSQKQLTDSAMALFGRKIKVLTYDVRASDLRYAMNSLQKSNPSILEGFSAKTKQGQDIKMDFNKNSDSWNLPLDQRNKIVQVDVVVITNSAEEMAAIEKKIQTSSTLNQFVKDNSSVVSIDNKTHLTQADFDAAFAFKRREIMIEEGKATLFQGLIFGLSVYNLSTQYGEYDLSLAQDIRDKMRAEMARALIDVVLMLPPLANSATKFTTAAFAGFLNTHIQDSTSLIESLRTMGAFAKWAGIAAAVKTVIDGVMSFNNGLGRYKEGEGYTATLYLVGSICQSLSGVFNAIALLLPGSVVAGPFAIIAIVFGVAAWILMELFKDPSDEWNEMQRWFNRCYFGKWTHKKNKGEPYPATDLGYCLAINDYNTALFNCTANVALEDSKVMSTTFRGPHVSTTEAEYALNRLDRQLQLNMLLTGFDQIKSSYKGRLIITDKSKAQKMSLYFSKADRNVMVKEGTEILSNWQMRTMDGIELKLSNGERYWLIDENGKTQAELANETVATTTHKPTSQPNNVAGNDSLFFLRVNQILGKVELEIKPKPLAYQLVMYYWRDKSENKTPLLLSYDYTGE